MAPTGRSTPWFTSFTGWRKRRSSSWRRSPGDGAALAPRVFSSGLSLPLRRPALPRRAVVRRDREGKEEDEGADVGPIEGLKLAGRGARGWRAGRSFAAWSIFIMIFKRLDISSTVSPATFRWWSAPIICSLLSGGFPHRRPATRRPFSRGRSMAPTGRSTPWFTSFTASRRRRSPSWRRLPGEGVALASGVFPSGLSWALRRPALPRRAVVFRDREGKEEDEGADVGSVEGHQSAGWGA